MMDPQADAFRPILPLVLALPLIAIAFTSRRVHVSGWHRFATIVMALTALSVSVPAAMMTVFEGRADDSFPAWMSAVFLGAFCGSVLLALAERVPKGMASASLQWGLLGVVLTTVADIDTWTMLTSTTAGMVAVGYNFVNTVATLRRCLRALDKGDEHDDGDDAEYAMSSTATLKSNRSSVWMAVRWTCNAVAHMASWTVIAVYSYRSRVHGDHSLEEVASLSVMGAIALTLLDFALFYFPQHATTPEAGFEMIALLIPQLLTLHLARGGNRRDGDTAVPWNSEWAHVVLEEMVGGVIALMAAYVVMVVDARTGNEDEADDDGDDRHISCKVIDDDERHPLLHKSGRV